MFRLNSGGGTGTGNSWTLGNLVREVHRDLRVESGWRGGAGGSGGGWRRDMSHG